MIPYKFLINLTAGIATGRVVGDTMGRQATAQPLNPATRYRRYKAAKQGPAAYDEQLTRERVKKIGTK